MWKRLVLGAALLLVLGAGLALIDKPVIGEPTAVAQNSNSGSGSRSMSSNRSPSGHKTRRHRTHRRTRRTNKNMQ